MRLIFLALLLSGCAKSESAPTQYPVTAKYGLHTLPMFITTKCFGIYDFNCQTKFWDRFGKALYDQYGQTTFNAKMCSYTDVCLDDYSYEAEYRK